MEISWKFLTRCSLGRAVGADQSGGSKSCIFVFNVVRMQSSAPSRPVSPPDPLPVFSVTFHGAGWWRVRLSP